MIVEVLQSHVEVLQSHMELTNNACEYIWFFTDFLKKIRDICSGGDRYIAGWNSGIPIYEYRALSPAQKQLLDSIEKLVFRHEELRYVFGRYKTFNYDIEKMFRQEDVWQSVADFELDIPRISAMAVQAQEQLRDSIEDLIFKDEEPRDVFDCYKTFNDDIENMFRQEDVRQSVTDCGLDIAQISAMAVQAQNKHATVEQPKICRHDLRNAFDDFRYCLEYLIQILQAFELYYEYLYRLRQFWGYFEHFEEFSGDEVSRKKLGSQFQENIDILEYLLEMLHRTITLLRRFLDSRGVERIAERHERDMQVLYGCPTAKIFQESGALRNCSVEIVAYE